MTNAVKRVSAHKCTNRSSPLAKSRKGRKPVPAVSKTAEALGVDVKFNITTFGGIVFSALDTPIALEAKHHLESGAYPSLIRMQVDPNAYTNAHSYLLDKQAVALLQKYPDFKHPDLNPEQRARETFYACERSCAKNNIRWQWLCLFENECNVPHEFHNAKRKIHEVLGVFDADEWGDAMRFGPGAASAVTGSSDYAKLSSDPSITQDLKPFAAGLFNEFPAWVGALTYGGVQPLKIKVLAGGKYSQVSKSAETNRNIEVQPLLNGFCQLGLGSMIRLRLKSNAKIDLNDQSRNQDLAEFGSKFWQDVNRSVATIDLSNASDLICRELVRWLLPPDWFHAMDITRTHSIEIDGKDRPLQRFCSMGNGFCFELESLIFWALTASAVESLGLNTRNVSVYGDDIICPVRAYVKVCSTLSDAGFEVNAKKSFHEGPFRESCGSDWWNGCYVRPIYVKEHPYEPGSCVRLANRLYRIASVSCLGYGLDSRFRGAIHFVQRSIPLEVRSKIIRGWGEVHPMGDAQLQRRKRLGLQDRAECVSDTDDILLDLKAPFHKRRKVLVFLTKRYYDLNWYPSLATALYRLWRREEKGVAKPILDSLDACDLKTIAMLRKPGRRLPRSEITPLPNDRELTRLYDYRRGDGYWTWRSGKNVKSSRTDHVSWI